MNWYSPVIYIGALVIGSVIGVLTGMFGVGGGFLITPLLSVVLGLPVPIAVGTGLLQILGTSTGGLYRRRNDGEIDYKLAVVLFGGNLVGVNLGSGTLENLKAQGQITVNGNTMAAADFYTLIIYVVMLGLIAAWMLYATSRRYHEPDVPVGLFSKIKIPPYTTFPSLDVEKISIPVLVYFGMALGYLTGLLGIGGGVVLLPALVYLVGMRTHRATATSLVMVWLGAVVAIVPHTLQGNARIDLAVALLLGGATGLQAGVALAKRLGGTELRRYFSWVVVLAMVIVGAKLVVSVL